MPIVFLSTKRQLEDRVTGLETGADDYIVKPFEPLEMIARVKAQLRRAQELNRSGGEKILRAGRLTVDTALQDALIDGNAVGLTQKEFQLLHLLASRAGQGRQPRFPDRAALGRRRARVGQERGGLHPAYPPEDRADPDDPEILLTVRGFGYRVATGGEA